MNISAIIPCYKVREHVLSVIAGIPPCVNQIIVVDDCCPEATGCLVKEQCSDPRVKIIFHEQNKGVGGAMISGYCFALESNADIVVKIDGDGQINPALIPQLIHPIIDGSADYTKGNRFFNLESLKQMPLIRIFGNSVLSFVSKAASGYWNLMDPTNGFTAIHTSVLKLLPLQKIDNRYFFESDMLFRLYTVRAVVRELPMDAKYGSENSNLNIQKVCFDFPGRYLVCFLKRLFYSYFLRDFNTCSVSILLGSFLTLFGFLYGGIKWYQGFVANQAVPLGSIMLATLPIILGFQLIIAAVNFDVINVPKEPIHQLLIGKYQHVLSGLKQNGNK